MFWQLIFIFAPFIIVKSFVIQYQGGSFKMKGLSEGSFLN